MRKYLSLLFMELKRAFHTIPQLLLGAIVLSFLIGTIAFCSGKLLYPERSLSQISIALILEEDPSGEGSPSMLSAAVDFVSDMDSTSGLFHFEIMDEDTAYHLLDTKQLTAIIQLPSDVMDNILEGTNVPVQIIFPKSSDLSTILLQELTTAGAKTLASAQADIYVIADLYVERGLQEYLEKAFQDVNIMNLNYALVRSNLFSETSTSLTGDYSVVTYYASAAILLLLLLWGTNCSQFLKRETFAFYAKLTCCDVKDAGYILIKWITVWLTLMITAMLIGVPIFLLARILIGSTVLFSAYTLLSFCLITLSIAAFILLTYQLAPTPSSGILSLFVISVLLLFLSGGFLPPAFFPPALKTVSAYLPTTYWMRQLANALSEGNSLEQVWPILIYTTLFYGFSVLLYRIRGRASV